MEEIYLDNSATTRTAPEVLETIKKMMDTFYGNPSSLHKKGMEAEHILEKARDKVAAILGAKSDEIIFTSGGTESNNLAIKGIADAYHHRGRHIISSKIEHPSVLEPLKYLEKKDFSITYLGVNQDGEIDLEDLKKSLKEETILVSIMHVNNEIGTVQPYKKIGAIIKENSRAFYHCDMVQSFLRLPIQLDTGGPDLITLSGHKVHALKGVGVLYKKKKIHIEPILHGGGQENNIRSGTENTLSIAGLSAILHRDMENKRVQMMRDYLFHKIAEGVSNIKMNTPLHQSAPHILNISFPRLKGEVLIHALEEDNIYVSTGSACHSRQSEFNHVLKAIGLNKEEIEGSIRISLSYQNTIDEIDFVVKKMIEVVQLLQDF